MGIFKKLRESLKKTREAFSRKIDAILSKGELNDVFYDELEEALIGADCGAKTSMEIVDSLRIFARKNKIRTADEVRESLRSILSDQFSDSKKFSFQYPCIISVVGVNGVGKTTTIGKLAAYFENLHKTVTLVAGDTFRAAASDQLALWAEKTKTRIIKHAEGADAAAVVFDGISSAKSKHTDVLLVDTAGRLQTKNNLMEELSKINRVIDREYSQAQKLNFIVLDATTGQNALSQIKTFDEFVSLDGIILTKLDGTAKGGVIVAIKKQFDIPVVFVGTGEKLDDIELFDEKEFVNNLF